MYKHLTLEERYHIQACKKLGYVQKDIAKEIGVHPSTISRELKRNSSSQMKRYTASKAEQIANDRRMYASRKSNKKINKSVEKLIVKYIKEDWSPEQVSHAALKLKYHIDISFVRIYQFIEQDRLKGGNLHTHLRFYNKKRRIKYGTANSMTLIKQRVSIEQRPSIVNDKSRVGDFEIDTIIGENRKGVITTAVDRASSFTKISMPTSKKASDVRSEVKRILLPFKDKIFTVTSDNGLEFADHVSVSKSLDCDWYFCHPYSSWERGLNEHTNGLIRQYIPKGTSFENITANDIKRIENKLNNRPRKSLNWKTPNEVFYGKKIVA